MTTQEILQLLDEKRVLTAPAAVAWDEVQRQQNRLNQAAKRLNGPMPEAAKKPFTTVDLSS